MAKHQSTATMVNGSKVNETMMATGAVQNIRVQWWWLGGVEADVFTLLEQGWKREMWRACSAQPSLCR